MKRMLVISDIHGELEKFERLLEAVRYRPEEDQLILLGDYVDRGPNARGVIEKVIALKEAGALVLKGNHEDLMIKALTTEEERAWKRWAQINGGDMTLRSYGFTEANFAVDENAETFVKPTLQSEILSQHLAFITNLEHYIETDDYIFVHAGVQPGTPISETDPHTLMWIRDEFHTGYSDKKMVVFGHTSTDTLHGDTENFNVYFGVNRIIGIDGGAVYGGQLNALELPSQQVYMVKEV
ncbi:serine/threonine protein phosphatase [Paenibacillus sp. CGMCC 1.16610]|uniref:Serine/threonine protein phosphatase n=1 Tax=Paenibacillus anseongense TaxID=2682845 RepID=A0ABW9UB88_9BACL|nr:MULTISPECIES: metallophosphoesterase family protein [Paenibacillus]MBA2937603.1 serine/threonine protein phosphatase [Paenibacillus sp. CGMCC 1.16610]MVQ36661.1 serine/threonine protein phosphatase [Paenibacillus anseongense]